MRTWYTSKPCEDVDRSHINKCVYDSSWEATEAYILDKNKNVEAWVKNDHLGFVILYNFKGVISKYFPDFIVKLKSDKHLILEVKGIDDEKNKAKRSYLGEWVKAINEQSGFGVWDCAVSYSPGDLGVILSTTNEQKAGVIQKLNNIYSDPQNQPKSSYMAKLKKLQHRAIEGI